MRVVIRLTTPLALVLSVLLVASAARAQTFAIVGGTVHSDSTLGASQDVTLSPSMPYGQAESKGQTEIGGEPLFTDFQTYVGVQSNQVYFSFYDLASADQNIMGSGSFTTSGNNTEDVFFTLSATSPVELISTGPAFRPPLFTGTVTLLDSSENTISTFSTVGDSYVDLGAGTYEIKSTVSLNGANAPTAEGDEIEYTPEFMIDIAPEPATGAMLVVAAAALASRRPGRRSSTRRQAPVESAGYANHPAADLLQYIHDDRLVRAP